tara:strand:- start:1815 stop:2012 length:198 start_codon:yes stop_codon:yes gene_type:complete
MGELLKLNGCPKCKGTMQEDLMDPGTWMCVHCGNRVYPSVQLTAAINRQNLIPRQEFFDLEEVHE